MNKRVGLTLAKAMNSVGMTSNRMNIMRTSKIKHFLEAENGQFTLHNIRIAQNNQLLTENRESILTRKP